MVVPSQNIFEELEEYIKLNEVPVPNDFKMAWSRLTDQAKNWAKLNVYPGNNATYGHLREALEFAFPNTNIKCFPKTELYGKLQEKGVGSLQFLMHELELLNLLNITMMLRVKAELKR